MTGSGEKNWQGEFKLRDRLLTNLITSASVALLCLAFGVASFGQASEVDAAVPAGPTPHLRSGVPDLGGKGTWGLPYITDVSRPGRGADQIDIPFQPWAEAVFDARQANNSRYDPEGYCLPPGIPRALGTPYPMQFIQEEGRIIQIFEGGAHIWREIFMDGRAHPEGDALNPTYNGHSVGHWEGETLVVDVVGFNERTWLDIAGHPHTDGMQVTERYTRTDLNTLSYEATIDDPKTYTRPWTTAWTIPWRAGQELQEYICQENNQYLESLITEEVMMSLEDDD
jgi:hypothetical protein